MVKNWRSQIILKNSLFGKNPKFFWPAKNLIHSCVFFYLKNGTYSAKTAWGKIQIFRALTQNAFNQSVYRVLWSSISPKRINQYLRFLHGDNHQAKVASQATTLGWVWLVVPLDELDCGNLTSSISSEWINWHFRFLHGIITKGK